MPRLVFLPPAALLLALCAAQATRAAVPTPVEVFERVRPAVARVELHQGDTPLQGSAVALGGGRFVTVCSLLAGAETLRVATGAQRWEATRLAGDSSRNLCLLHAPGAEDSPALPTAPGVPAVGSRVYAVSNALGLGLGITEGVLSGVRTRGAATLLQFSAPVSPGSDGGALVDGEGRLLGLIEVGLREGQNLNFAVAAAAIGEIEARQERDVRRQALRDQAPRLLRNGEGERLHALAGEWTQLYPQDAEGWTWLASAAELRRDAVAEEAAWRQAEARDPGSLEAGLGLAGALMRQRRFDAAHEAALALVAAHRDSAGAWALLGAAQFAHADVEAEASLRQALVLDPWHLPAHRLLVLLAQVRGDHAAAAATWDVLTRRFPDQPALRWQLVESRIRAGDAAGAWATIEALPAALAESADGLFWRAEVLAALGRPEQAITLLRRSLALGPTDASGVWSRLGQLCHEQQRLPESIAAHREAVRLAPASTERRYWLAVSLKDGGHLDEALELGRRLVQEWPKSAAAWSLLGLAHGAALQTQDSNAALERSLALDPKQPRAWSLLIQQYRAAGRSDAVLQAYDRLRSLDLPLAERSYRATVAPYLQDARAAGTGAVR